ncbi:MAG: subclass B3 metallo-beta-lactamase [Phycisphaerales bacterium]
MRHGWLGVVMVVVSGWGCPPVDVRSDAPARARPASHRDAGQGAVADPDARGGADGVKEEGAGARGAAHPLSAQNPHWVEAVEPFRIAGPLHYVGTRGLGSYLLVTSDGNVLFNTGMPGSGEMIVESMRKLGYEAGSVKLIINSHAHIDHAGGLAYLRETTGAPVAIMDRDVASIEDGGRSDFHYGDDAEMWFPACNVDRVLKDGEEIVMGEVRLRAHLTAGHTRGSTTWVARFEAEGRELTVVWPDGVSVNPGYRLGGEESYPGIAEDYRRTFEVLEGLRPDVWLAAHTEWFGLEKRMEAAKTEGLKAWLNREEYGRWVGGRRRAFERVVGKR